MNDPIQTPDQLISKIAAEFTDSEGRCPPFDQEELRLAIAARDRAVRARALNDVLVEAWLCPPTRGPSGRRALTISEVRVKVQEMLRALASL